MILACTAFHSSIYLDYIVRNVFYSKSLNLHGPLKGLTLTLKSFIFRPLLGFPTCWWNTLKYFGPYLEWIWTRFSMNSLQIRTCIYTYILSKEFSISFFTDGIPFLCFWFSMIIYERMIIWKMANSTSICEQHLRHKWSDTLTWWKAQSLNLSIKVSKKKDGKSKGKYYIFWVDNSLSGCTERCIH